MYETNDFKITELCKYCKYQTKCFNDGNGLTDKPLSIPNSKNETED